MLHILNPPPLPRAKGEHMIEYIASAGLRSVRVWGYHERHARYKASLRLGTTNFTLTRAAVKVPVYFYGEA